MITKIESKNIGKEYKEGKIPTTNLYYYGPVKTKMFGNGTICRMLSKKYAEDMLMYSSSYVEEFKRVLGRQHFVFRREFNNYAWAVEYSGCKAIIFSAKGKGTSVELLLDEKGNPEGDVMAFFKKFTQLLRYIKD